jgi:hypothetical protein
LLDAELEAQLEGDPVFGPTGVVLADPLDELDVPARDSGPTPVSFDAPPAPQEAPLGS